MSSKVSVAATHGCAAAALCRKPEVVGSRPSSARYVELFGDFVSRSVEELPAVARLCSDCRRGGAQLASTRRRRYLIEHVGESDCLTVT